MELAPPNRPPASAPRHGGPGSIPATWLAGQYIAPRSSSRLPIPGRKTRSVTTLPESPGSHVASMSVVAGGACSLAASGAWLAAKVGEMELAPPNRPPVSAPRHGGPGSIPATWVSARTMHQAGTRYSKTRISKPGRPFRLQRPLGTASRVCLAVLNPCLGCASDSVGRSFRYRQ